jgi:hypothetical protein
MMKTTTSTKGVEMMDKEQRKRMAYRTIVQEDEQQGDIEYTVQVSGDRVEIHQTYDHEWDNESGTGPDISHETWEMSKDVLKKLISAAQWCIEKSEAFEASHHDEVRDEIARQLRIQRGTDER